MEIWAWRRKLFLAHLILLIKLDTMGEICSVYPSQYSAIISLWYDDSNRCRAQSESQMCLIFTNNPIGHTINDTSLQLWDYKYSRLLLRHVCQLVEKLEVIWTHSISLSQGVIISQAYGVHCMRSPTWTCGAASWRAEKHQCHVKLGAWDSSHSHYICHSLTVNDFFLPHHHTSAWCIGWWGIRRKISWI